MTEQKKYLVWFPDGHRIERRGIAFLICENDKNINAKSVFDNLELKREREIRSRFDLWLAGGINDRYFHGWPNNPIYKNCFVFKYKDKNQHHRFYSFLCNPMPNNLSFQLCVVVAHAQKNTKETDLAELDGINDFIKNNEVTEAIVKALKDRLAGIKEVQK